MIPGLAVVEVLRKALDELPDQGPLIPDALQALQVRRHASEGDVELERDAAGGRARDELVDQQLGEDLVGGAGREQREQEVVKAERRQRRGRRVLQPAEVRVLARAAAGRAEGPQAQVRQDPEVTEREG